MDDLKSTLGSIYDIGFKQAMQHKWITLDKSGGAPMVVRKVIVSVAQLFLLNLGRRRWTVVVPVFLFA